MWNEEQRLFFHTMRQPEMRIMRKALWNIKYSQDIAWSEVESWAILILSEKAWMLETNFFQLYTPDSNFPPDDFSFWYIHCDEMNFCKCEHCGFWRKAHKRNYKSFFRLFQMRREENSHVCNI